MANQPNVLILYTDQQRYDSLGCTGNPYAETPNLDELARQGTVFHRHIVANPVCGPSRCCFMSGRYPSGNGVWQNGIALPRKENLHYLPEIDQMGQTLYGENIISHVPTMADTFKEGGYETASIGKLHLNPYRVPADSGSIESWLLWEQNRKMEKWHGPYYGFDHVELSLGHGEQTHGHYRYWLEREYPNLVKQIREGSHVKERKYKETDHVYESILPEKAHHSTWVADQAIQYLKERKRDQPFFLYAGFPDPHSPISPPKELAEKYAQRDTLMPHINSEEWERMPKALRDYIEHPEFRVDTRQWPEELIWLARQYTDAMVHLVDKNAGRIIQELKDQGLWEDTIIVFSSDHGDFLGDHGALLKENICNQAINHVPFILRAPGANLPPESGATMSNTDVFPTLCELVGIPVPQGVQGKSILNSVRGGGIEPVLVQCYYNDPIYHNFTIYDQRFRLTWYPHTEEFELYDHKLDPYEMHNVTGFKEYKEMEAHLFSELLLRHVKANVPVGNRAAIY
jgi:arylsulfatase